MNEHLQPLQDVVPDPVSSNSFQCSRFFSRIIRVFARIFRSSDNLGQYSPPTETAEFPTEHIMIMEKVRISYIFLTLLINMLSINHQLLKEGANKQEAYRMICCRWPWTPQITITLPYP